MGAKLAYLVERELSLFQRSFGGHRTATVDCYTGLLHRTANCTATVCCYKCDDAGSLQNCHRTAGWCRANGDGPMNGLGSEFRRCAAPHQISRAELQCGSHGRCTLTPQTCSVKHTRSSGEYLHTRSSGEYLHTRSSGEYLHTRSGGAWCREMQSTTVADASGGGERAYTLGDAPRWEGALV
ncbi:Hypp6257 [Branchiostoma lanceolatum]|uniref:Hypp6257 protein n=1 Tax=Branchiostoma lanceolatum TaxID=7740 RepID=A0A8J9YQ58_BRALA|nr:Hypp6257 [Branchiostoma lanceolatum]